jgi:Sporulation related domain.
MKRLITISILVFCLPLYSHSQTTSTAKQPAIISQLEQPVKSQGKVQIIQDDRIGDLLNKIAERNALKKTMPGFRVKIFSKSSQDARKRAFDTKSKFLNSYSGLEAYVKYEEPDWKVYVGDFRTRTDALRVKMQLEALFPEAIIVKTDIDYTKL